MVKIIGSNSLLPGKELTRESSSFSVKSLTEKVPLQFVNGCPRMRATIPYHFELKGFLLCQDLAAEYVGKSTLARLSLKIPQKGLGRDRRKGAKRS